MSIDLYARVTDQIVTMLEAGVVPWRNPILGRGTAGHPRNLVSGKPYRGVNVFLLAFTAWSKGYSSSCWVTFNQCKAQGGAIRKGERSSMVVFWKWLDKLDDKTREPVRIPMLRYFNVFNAEQCDGINAPDQPIYTPTEFSPIEACEKLVTAYDGKPSIEHGGSQAFYQPTSDTVRLPERSRFESAEAYYATLFHELAHSTGHSSRLDRDIDTKLAPFGSVDYGREELVAEMATAFLCGHCGIEPATIGNSASYIAGWIKSLKGDKRLAITAAGAAQKAADWIRGERPSANPVFTDAD